MTWAKQQRQEFIRETVNNFGVIGRADLMIKFGIKEACATRDLDEAAKRGVISYNPKTKCYEARNAVVVKLDDMRPHVTHEVICVQCCARWMAVAPVETFLKDYECPTCGPGYVIKTGQDLNLG